MESPNPLNTIAELDPKLLSRFVQEMNIARRLVVSYPENHPVIAESINKVLDILSELLGARNDFTIGIAKNILLVGNSSPDRNNPVNRDLANLLFSQGIAAITFTRQLTAEELLTFYSLIALKREQLEEEGGVAQAMGRRGVTGIQARAIDYSAFQASEDEYLDGPSRANTEEQSPFLWENFVRSLLAESLDQQGQLLDLDPGVLAELLNRRKKQQKSSGSDDARSYAGSIASFIQQLGQEGRGRMREQLICRLATFIARLSPELRSQFLNSAFSSLADRPELAESVLSNIPEEAIIGALEELNARKESIPQIMMGIIGKLSGKPEGKAASFAGGGRPGARNAVEERIRTIFQEDSMDKFLPEAYQKQLHTIVSQGLDISSADQPEVEDLKLTLSGHLIEERISFIILDILKTSSADCDMLVMERNLVDLCTYFLELGDFNALFNIYSRIQEQAAASHDHLQEEVLRVFAKDEFVEEVLNGLRIWGKNKYTDIGALIDRIGEPFVAPLLERLAEEQSMSLRRYYMDRLLAIGDIIKNAVVERLRDNRWYFVRNMILLLHNLGDPEAVPQIRRLAGHPHPKVRQEAILSLLHFGDAEANRLLIRDLTSTDFETLLNAVRIAEGSSHPEILKKLVENLNRRGLSANDCELKRTVIQTLGKIGNPSVLPELERILSSRSFFHSAHLTRLKEDAVQSLKFYPRKAVTPLLNALAKSGQEEIRRRAEEIYRQMQGGEHDS